MRITLDLDDGILRAVNERAQRDQRTVDELVSDLLRQALAASTAPATPSSPLEAISTYGFRPFAKSGALVTNALINEMRDDGL